PRRIAAGSSRVVAGRKVQVVTGSPCGVSESFEANISLSAAAASGAIRRSRSCHTGSASGDPITLRLLEAKVHPHEVGKNAHAELRHEACSMQLDGLGADAELVGDRLVEL